MPRGKKPYLDFLNKLNEDGIVLIASLTTFFGRRPAVKEVMVGNFLIHTPYLVAKYATKVAKEGWKLVAVCNSAVKKGSVEMQISAFFEREPPAPPAEQPKTVQLPPGAYFDKSGHH